MMTITTIPSEILDQLLAGYMGSENLMGGSRALARQELYQGRQSTLQTCPLHSSARRHAL